MSRVTARSAGERSGRPARDGATRSDTGRAAHDAQVPAYDELARQINDLYEVTWMNRNHVWFAESPEVTGDTTFGQGTPLSHAFGRAA